jgi:hypothetical protein
MSGVFFHYEGVNFDTIRLAIAAIYFWRKDMTPEEWAECVKYVVPMQHNVENPIKPGSQDTWIQYWIDEDDRVTQDYSRADKNQTLKVAHITLRFLGVRAEQWAKAFHHLTKRKSVGYILEGYCRAVMLEYVSPVVPINVDYFGTGNTTIAFTLGFDLKYVESIKLCHKPLEYISIAPGEILYGGLEEDEDE